MEMTPELLERLAEAAHDVWMEGKIRDGWTYASVTDKAAKKHSCLVPYAELSEEDKESDRDMVRGIPAILAKAGMSIAPAGEAQKRPDAWAIPAFGPGEIASMIDIATSSGLPDPKIGTITGCTCPMCEFHRSAEAIGPAKSDN